MSDVIFSELVPSDIERAISTIEAFIAGGDEMGDVPVNDALDELDTLACAARQGMSNPTVQDCREVIRALVDELKEVNDREFPSFDCGEIEKTANVIKRGVSFLVMSEADDDVVGYAKIRRTVIRPLYGVEISQ